MHQPSDPIERFFRTFESNASSDNTDAVISQFADVFMAASPHGAQAVRAGDFAIALPKKKLLFDRLGCRSTELISVRENRLDARYALATTRWKMTFTRPELEQQDVVVDSVFIVDTGGEAATPDAAKKRGFVIPAAAWINGEMRTLVGDLLSTERIRQQAIFEPSYVQRLLDEHRSGRTNHAKKIWSLMMFELWHDKWLSQSQAQTSQSAAEIKIAA